MGSLYHRKNASGRVGKIWWCKYYQNGRPIRESTNTTKKTEAKRFLKEREGRVATGQAILPKADRVPYEELANDLQQHYEATGERNLREADTRLNPLGKFFSGFRVVNIGPSQTSKYIQWRQGQGISNSTINRELSVLLKMLKLGYEQGKVLRIPTIRKLKEPAPRQGFFEREDFETVRGQLPERLRLAVTIAYTYGWRMQSEVLTLERRHIDLEEGTIRLDPGTTKNDEGRLVYLTIELRNQVELQLKQVDELSGKLGRIIPFLFPHFMGRLAGERLKDFRKAWKNACKRAGCPGFLRHDFRRTAVRNMVNKGVVERVAMTVTGHKSRSVFDRYHIVSPSDLQDVARKLMGTISGTPKSQVVD